MLRRRRRSREIPFSFDSFLDVVANVVGIIIRLILVVWVGAPALGVPLPARLANGPAGKKCSSARPLCGRSCATVVTIADCPYDQPCVAMPACSRTRDFAPSAATSSAADTPPSPSDTAMRPP